MSGGRLDPEVRLVLLGNIGCGKTSSADTILNRVAGVATEASRRCQPRDGPSEGRRVSLVEAPRWYWTGGKMVDDVKQETERAAAMLEPGPHAILLLVPVGQFTEMEAGVPAELEDVFGDNVLDHTLVLLTCGDYLMGKTPEEYLQREHPGLRRVIERCGGRFHVFNNRQRHDRRQVEELLAKVDELVQEHGVFVSKSPQQRELERRVKQRKTELLESFRAQKGAKTRAAEASSAPDAETLRRGEDRVTILERRSEGRETEGRTSNGSDWAPEQRSDPGSREHRQLNRTNSYKLNADGALLSQISDQSSPKRISTFHHRINSFEERSPEASPTATPPSPAFQPSSFTASSSLSSSSSSFLPSSSSLAFSSSSTPQTYNPSSSSLSSSSSSFLSSSSSSSFSSTPQTYNASSSSFSSSSSSFLPSSSSLSFSSSNPQTINPSSSSLSSSSSSFLPSSSSSSPSSSSLPQTFPASSSSLSSSSSFLPSSSSSSFSSTPQTFPASSSSLSSSSTPPSYLSSSSSSSSSSSPELRLILLGRSGAGKSAAGNAILGLEEFESRPDSLTSITQRCEKKKGAVEGRKVAVVDTPDWFNSEKTPDEVRTLISSCVALASPGPHAFLMCVPIDLPAKTELQALGALENVFGAAAVEKHTVVLFTHADRLRASGTAGSDGVEAYIAGQRGDLLKLVEKCGDRFHVMEGGGGGGRGRGNVAELLEKVEQTVKEAGGQCYSCPAFMEAESKVRQRQAELAKERQRRAEERVEVPRSRVLYSYMQPVLEGEEDLDRDELDKTRDEAERSVGSMNIESLPAITASTLSPSLLRSLMDRIQSGTRMLPRLLADGSALVGGGAKRVKDSPVWGRVGSGAQNVQKMVADSGVWGRVGATAGTVSKAVGDRVPKVVVDGSTWVGSGAKAVASSPMWGKVSSGAQSGAKIMADNSMRLGAGIGTGAKNLAQSPVWGKVGSRAKSGAKLMASGSKRVGAGLGAGAKKVAASPVWGKVGSGAKAGVKMVADSSAWERVVNAAKQVPKVVVLGAVLGLVLGVFLGGAVGGAIGAAAGSAATEVGRRKIGNKSSVEKTEEAARNMERTLNDGVDSALRRGEKALKSE